jgi:hypothetical protein
VRASRRPGRAFRLADRTAQPDRAYPEPNPQKPALFFERRNALNGLPASRPNVSEPNTDQDACPTTIERKSRIWSFDAESANNRGSNLNGQPRGFSRLTPPSTTTASFKDT